MQKYLLGAATAAFMMVGAGSAMAVFNPADCGALPNPKWSWSVSEVGGGEPTSVTTYGDVSYSGASGNGSALATTTTTTPGSTIICTALNPAGKPNADHSTSFELPPVIDTSTETLQVCFNAPNTPDLLETCR